MDNTCTEGAPMFTRRALLIVNPVSGKRAVLRYLPQIIRIFMDAGCLVTTAVTARRGEATALAREYGKEFDLVCCTGGDGTLNETVTGLAQAGTQVPLGYIPCGSTNDFALSRGLSDDILTAAERAARGGIHRYDIGRFGDRYFTYIAAFGAFSWLSYTTDQNLKNVLGHTAYILDGIKDLSKIKPLPLRVRADGVLYEGEFIFGAVCNTTSVGGTIELPRDSVDTCDGRLELLLIRAPKTILDLQQAALGLLTQDYDNPFTVFTQARAITVENPPGLEWALDGESSGPCDKVHIAPIPGFLLLQQ